MGRPYYVAVSSAPSLALFDPLGIELLFISTIPAAFGGLSGFDVGRPLMPASSSPSLRVRRHAPGGSAQRSFGIAYVVIPAAVSASRTDGGRRDQRIVMSTSIACSPQLRVFVS